MNNVSQSRAKGSSGLSAEYAIRHPALYEGSREGIFWLRTEECAAHCHCLLTDEALRREIARRGHERAVRTFEERR